MTAAAGRILRKASPDTPKDAADGPDDDAARLADGGLPARRLGPGARSTAWPPLPPDQAVARRPWWHPQFEPVACGSFDDFDTCLGHEIAREMQLARQAGRPLVFILPVGPMGMYRWTVYFLNEWGVPCDHVHGFNMDEWSDARRATRCRRINPGGFQHAMEQAFYGPLGKQHRAAETASLRPEERSCRPTPSRSPT